MDLNLRSPIGQLGYGIAGLNFLLNLAGKIDVSLFPIGNIDAPPNHHDLIRNCLGNSSFFNPKAPTLILWHQHSMAESIGKGLRIGFPIFELNKFSQQEEHHLKSLDKIFVCSEWAQDIIKKYISVPSCLIPLGVDRSIFHEGFDNHEETVFLHCGKWEIRKGIDLIYEAFNKVFDPKDKVKLILNCYNPFIGPANKEWGDYFKNSKLGNKVFVIPQRLNTQKEVADLMRHSDVLLAPSRAEGWNLELLEAMSCGKSVIATNYSGHTQFCTAKNAYLIEIDKLESAFDGTFFFGNGEWGKLEKHQVDQFCEYMKFIHKMKQENGPLINKKGIETAQRFNWGYSSDVILNNLN